MGCVNTTVELRKLAETSLNDPRLMASLDRMEARTKDVMRYSILPYRSKIFKMGQMLIDCVQFAKIDDVENAEASARLLIEKFNDVVAVYKENDAALRTLLHDFDKDMMLHLDRSSAEHWRFVVTAAGGGGAGLGGLIGGLLSIHAGFPPLLVAGSCGMACGGAAFGWRQRKEAQKEKSLSKASALYKKLVQQIQLQWDGVNVWVLSLEETIGELKEHNPKSQRARSAAMAETAQKLFGMSMAVDEFIFWMDKRMYFPTNLSIRNILGPDRYDCISTIVDTDGTKK